MLTDAQIIDMVKKNGTFSVTWQYRNDKLRQQCNRLVKQGKIKKGKRMSGADLFVGV